MKNKTRLFISVLAVMAMLVSLCAPIYAGTKDAVRVSLDGKMLDQTAIKNEDTVFLPLRAVCEALGYRVEWSQEKQSVTVSSAVKTVVFEPKTAIVNDAGHSYYADEGYSAENYIGGGCILVNSHIYTASGILADCLGMNANLDQTGGTLTLTPAPKSNVTVENKKIYSDESKLMTNIQYPYISTAVSSAADQINAVILADVKTAQKEAQDNLKEYGDDQSPNRCETYFNYRIAYQKGELLSLVLLDYQYYGGAHGSTRQITHTFDVNTGKEYTLSDLMKTGSTYKEFINTGVKADFVKRDLADAQLTEFVSIADNQSYYLSDSGVVVYFQQYEYFPYAAGIIECSFPYGEITGYLKPELQF